MEHPWEAQCSDDEGAPDRRKNSRYNDQGFNATYPTPANTRSRFEVDQTYEDGAMVFLHACKLGLEGIVSKRLQAPYRSGPSRDWIKVKNPDSPAMIRHREGRW
jgi:hypothetical protein